LPPPSENLEHHCSPARQPCSMVTYPCDPTPHLPPGMEVVPPNVHRRRRSYHIFSGRPLMNCDDWVIVVLEPPTDPKQFPADG
jgi:hypothetical protein